MKYGIELEYGQEKEKEEEIKEYMEEQGGNLKSDSSVHTRYPFISREINTKVYNEEEVKETASFFSFFYDKYVKEINESMGLHIHISFNELANFNALYSKRFISFFKKGLLEKFGHKEELKQRLKNRYCKPSYSKSYMQGKFKNSDRYKMINFMAYERHGTVEFRIFNAPKTAQEVINYLNFTLETVNTYLVAQQYKINIVAKSEPTPYKMELIEEINNKENKININWLGVY